MKRSAADEFRGQEELLIIQLSAGRCGTVDVFEQSSGLPILLSRGDNSVSGVEMPGKE